MNDLDIAELTNKYELDLLAELEAKRSLAVSEAGIQELRSLILCNAAIDGKNADARKIQEDAILAKSPEYQDYVGHIVVMKDLADRAYAHRVASEAYIGLLKAFLYSQARIG